MSAQPMPGAMAAAKADRRPDEGNEGKRVRVETDRRRLEAGPATRPLPRPDVLEAGPGRRALAA